MTKWLEVRQQALERDNYTCQTCLKKVAEDVHHIIPRRMNGLDTLNNLISQCGRCHGLIELQPIRKGKVYDIEPLQISDTVIFVSKILRMSAKDKILKKFIIVPKDFWGKVIHFQGKQIKVIVEAYD